MIYLPALGWTAESAGPLVSVLEEHYCLHRLDLPALGRSEPLVKIPKWNDLACWVYDYCRAHQWEQVRVIGHSIGGIIALAFADQFPDYVHQLVLLDAGYQPIPRFPSDVTKPLRYFVPLVNWLASLGGISWLTRWLEATDAKSPDPLIFEDNIEREFQQFVENQQLLITNELRNAFYVAHQTVKINSASLRLLLGIYRSKPISAFNRLKPATLLVVPEHMTHYPPLTEIDERGLPVLLYEVSGGHYVHYAHPDLAYVIRDFFDHWN